MLACIQMCVWVCACDWRPEDNVGCFSSEMPILFFEIEPLTGLELTSSVRLSGQRALRIFPQCWDYWYLLPTSPSYFIWVLGIKPRFLDCMVGTWLAELSPHLSSSYVVTSWVIILSVRRLRRKECHEFENSLSYIVSSRPEWATESMTILCYFG